MPRPTIRAADRVFWVTLRRLCSGWRDVLVIVKPDTVRSLSTQRLPPVLVLDSPVAKGPRRLDAFHRDSIFSAEVVRTVKAMGIEPA